MEKRGPAIIPISLKMGSCLGAIAWLPCKVGWGYDIGYVWQSPAYSTQHKNTF